MFEDTFLRQASGSFLRNSLRSSEKSNVWTGARIEHLILSENPIKHDTVVILPTKELSKSSESWAGISFFRLRRDLWMIGQINISIPSRMLREQKTVKTSLNDRSKKYKSKLGAIAHLQWNRFGDPGIEMDPRGPSFPSSRMDERKKPRLDRSNTRKEAKKDHVRRTWGIGTSAGSSNRCKDAQMISRSSFTILKPFPWPFIRRIRPENGLYVHLSRTSRYLKFESRGVKASALWRD